MNINSWHEENNVKLQRLIPIILLAALQIINNHSTYLCFTVANKKTINNNIDGTHLQLLSLHETAKIFGRENE